MIINVKLKLKTPALPADYRPVFVSLLKASLQNYEAGLYERWYKNGVTSKSFTFAVNLPEAKFCGDDVILGGNEIEWNISTADFPDGIDLYNALLKQKNKAYPLKGGNEMTIEKCQIQNQPSIKKDELTVRFLSPLVVRDHGADNLDRYFTYEDVGFDEKFGMVTRNQFELFGFVAENAEITLTPVAAKKTVVKIFGLKIPASFGVYKLKGRTDALDFLYRAGMGSRRNQGFGMFEVLKEGGE